MKTVAGLDLCFAVVSFLSRGHVIKNSHLNFLDAFLLNFHMIWSMMFLVIVLFTVSTRPCALSVLRTALSWPSKS